jgi:hypothetical protein
MEKARLSTSVYVNQRVWVALVTGLAFLAIFAMFANGLIAGHTSWGSILSLTGDSLILWVGLLFPLLVSAYFLRIFLQSRKMTFYEDHVVASARTGFGKTDIPYSRVLIGEMTYLNPMRNLGRWSVRFRLMVKEDDGSLGNYGVVNLHSADFYLWLQNRVGKASRKASG